MSDWQSALQSLLDNNELPCGDDTPQNSDDKAGQTAKMPTVTVFYERKGRGGKEATIIVGFDGMTDDEVSDVARILKQRLGTGGSSRGGEILIQGDRREQAASLLRDMGYKVKGV